MAEAVSEQRIRVVQLVQHVSLGGGTLLAMLLAERLDPNRYEVLLAAGSQAGSEGSLLEEMRRRGIQVELLPSLQRSPHPWRDLRAVLELRRLLKRQRPHIVHTHGSKPKLLLPWAARGQAATVRIAHIHGWEWHPAGSPLTRSLLTTGSRVGVTSYDALVTTSEALRHQGLERGVGRPDQYQVIRPGIDLRKFSPSGRDEARQLIRAELGLPMDAFVVISVMRLGPQKAPLDLIAAAESVAARRDDIRFLVVGGGPLEQAVRNEVTARALSDQVLLLGPRRDVAALLKASDLFVLTSRWEPLGIVYLEAAAVGLPCVGTNVDGAPEAVEEGATGYLVEPGEPRAVAAHQKAQEFSEEHFVAQIEGLYHRLLARRGIG